MRPYQGFGIHQGGSRDWFILLCTCAQHFLLRIGVLILGFDSFISRRERAAKERIVNTFTGYRLFMISSILTWTVSVRIYTMKRQVVHELTSL